MIRANELRIGNWVNLDWDGVVKGIQVTGITNNDSKEYARAWFGHFEDFSLSCLFPIPPTPEILLACGFEKHNNSNDYWEFYNLPNGWHIGHAHHSEPSAGVIKGGFFWGEDYKQVYSLHQLQNLYFALTGQELEYKP